ncbi:hypothetical protein FACS189428_0770 [Clostridia bacterium]|nr:hypothetical protein FACS189428_0770 [Clostridia bacterium]
MEHLNIGKEAIIPIFIKIAQLGKVISSEVVVDDVKVLRNDKVYLPVRGEGEEPVLNKVKERAKNRTTEEGL